ncbi:uncharacterized protein LOC141663523 [Apium graveolens]|uniref:uncharacterized protein LOC141663523 n=1 Tax=Apium graveolens TaxID=4045 RepID=UPI003D7A4137
MWGIDILGPFPVASGQRKFIVVAIDYFTKWIKAKALAKITTKQIAQFFWENVICRIELRFTSVAHPQANGQVEVSNRIILDGLKKRVARSRNTCVDELFPILWAYCTTCKVTTKAPPFMLAYGAEPMVLLEIIHGSSSIEAYEPETNEEGMRLALDLIDEVRDEANTRNAEHQRKASLYYNRRVKERLFYLGDLISRKIVASGVEEKEKLTQNWEMPYKVKKILGRGSCKLETLSGDKVPHTWNISNLKV